MRWKLVTWITIMATELSSILIRKRHVHYSEVDFAAMQKNTLGKALYLEMKKYKLSFKPNLISHDLKHILLGYKMNMPDELRICAFLFGNRSYNRMAMAYMFICVPFVPEILPLLRKDFKRGRATHPLKNIDLQAYAKMDLEACRKQFNVSPLKN
jgi:ubiquinone biosynthesis protein Coq4